MQIGVNHSQGETTVTTTLACTDATPYPTRRIWKADGDDFICIIGIDRGNLNRIEKELDNPVDANAWVIEKISDVREKLQCWEQVNKQPRYTINL